MINCYRSDVSKFFSTIFLISWIFIGNFILLNLFLAILLDGFESNEDEKENEDEFTKLTEFLFNNKKEENE